MTTTANALSRFLRAGGFRPMTDRRREGLFIGAGHNGVYLSCTQDNQRYARELSADVEQLLRDRGYKVERIDEYKLYAR